MDDHKTITYDEVVNWCTGGFSDYTTDRLTSILNGDYSLEEAREDILSFRKIQYQGNKQPK